MNTQFRDSISNIDLLLSRYRPGASATVRLKKTIPQLKKMLDQKNKKYNFPANVIDRAAYELDRKGGDHTKIDTLAIQFKDLSIKQIAKKQHLSVFDKKLTLHTINDFIDAKIDQCRVSNIQLLMSQTNVNQKFKRRIMQRLSDKSYDSDHQSSGINPANCQTKNAYHTVVRSYLKSYPAMTLMELVKALYSASKNSIWKVLGEQLEGCQQLAAGRGQQLKKKIRQNTLDILERKFAATLPVEYHRLDQYYIDHVRNNSTKAYLNNMGRPIWALSYLLLRAGKRESLIKFLQDENTQSCRYLAKDLSKYFSTTRKPGEDELAWRFHNISDSYIQQIYNIINGIPISDPSLVARPFDFIWFGLKTCSLSTYERETEFNITELQKHIVNCYEKDPNNIELTQALFYSLNYSYLLQIRNSLIDRDQKMHLAIVFELARFDENDLPLHLNYEEDLLSYANEVLVYGLDISLDYLGLKSTPESFIYALQELLINNDRVEQFFSFGLRNENPLQKYNYILEKFSAYNDSSIMFARLAVKYNTISHKFVTSARIMYYIVQNTPQAIQFLLNAQIESLLNPTMNAKEVTDSKALLETIISHPHHRQQITSLDRNIINFIEEYRRLIRAYANRDKNQLHTILNNSVYFPPLTKQASSLISHLIKIQYFTVYLNYIQLVIKSNDSLFAYHMPKKGIYEESIEGIDKNFDQVIDIVSRLDNIKIKPVERQQMQDISDELENKIQKLRANK